MRRDVDNAVGGVLAESVDVREDRAAARGRWGIGRALTGACRRRQRREDRRRHGDGSSRRLPAASIWNQRAASRAGVIRSPWSLSSAPYSERRLPGRNWEAAVRSAPRRAGTVISTPVRSEPMTRGTRIHRRRGFLLALMAAGLLAGLVGMHHLSVTVGGSAMSRATSVAVMAGDQTPAPAPPSDPYGGDHGSALLHLCLAVLTVVAMVLVPLLPWCAPVPPTTATVRRSPRAASTSRAPPRPAPSRLALLCVLRT